MNRFFLRIVLASYPAQQLYFEQYLREAGHEVIVVDAHGESALKAARLVHPDVVILNGPLRGVLDGVALAAALRTYEIPVVLATDPMELPSQLVQHFRLTSQPAGPAASS